MRLFIRTEASTALGMGHFMRCFAVAEAARAENIEVTFLLNEIRDSVAARIESIGAHGREVTGPLGYEGDFLLLVELGLSRRDWLLVDSYQATDNFIRTLSNAARIAVMDDLCLLESYDCALIINAAEAAFTMPYKGKTRAKLLLGADYAQIRQEFLHPPMPLVGEPSVPRSKLIVPCSDSSSAETETASPNRGARARLLSEIMRVVMSPATSKVRLMPAICIMAVATDRP